MTDPTIALDRILADVKGYILEVERESAENGTAWSSRRLGSALLQGCRVMLSEKPDTHDLLRLAACTVQTIRALVLEHEQTTGEDGFAETQ